MKTMTMSLLIVAVLAAALFLLVWTLTSNADAGKSAAAFAVAGLPTISSWLETMEAKKSSIPGQKMAIRPFEGFSIWFPVLVLAGTLLGFAILNIGGFFSGFITGQVRQALGGRQPDAATWHALFQVSFIANIPVVLVGSYLLGKWVSWRAASRGILAVILIALLTSSLNRGAELVLLPEGSWSAAYGSDKSIQRVLSLVAWQFAFILIPCLLGYWRGQTQRTPKYMAYLISALPHDTRDSLVDLAFTEVKRVVDARRTAKAVDAS